MRLFVALRLLTYDKPALEKLTSLQHDVYLEAWDNSYDSNGMWSDTLAVKALHEVHAMRQAASIETAASCASKAKAAATGARSKAVVASKTTPTAAAKAAARPARPKRGVATDATVANKRLCTKCRKPGRNSRTCTDQPNGAHTPASASTRNSNPEPNPNSNSKAADEEEDAQLATAIAMSLEPTNSWHPNSNPNPNPKPKTLTSPDRKGTESLSRLPYGKDRLPMLPHLHTMATPSTGQHSHARWRAD